MSAAWGVHIPTGRKMLYPGESYHLLQSDHESYTQWVCYMKHLVHLYCKMFFAKYKVYYISESVCIDLNKWSVNHRL